MKLLQKFLATVATAGFVIAQPVAAQAASQHAVERVSSRAQGEELAGTAGHAVLIIAVALGLLLLAEVTGLIDVFGNDDELPHSP